MQAEAGLGEDDKAWQSNLDALQNAIVDSGASGFYVNRKVKLSNVRPGRGSVLVANGVREASAEIGDLGSLKGAQKVNSFDRTLVGVWGLERLVWWSALH